MRFHVMATAMAAVLAASPALAQEETKPITIAGSVGLVNDYRFRGVSQSDEELAVQGGISLTHSSGFYAGTWGSNLAGWGTFGGSNTELDLYGGFKTEIASGINVDVGLTWYMYPGGASNTDFAEPYIKVSTTLGPVSALVGFAYAPKQEALGGWYLNGAAAQSGVYTNPGNKLSNAYVWGDVSGAIPDTGFTVKAHVGYSQGNAGLGPNGTSVAPTGKYIDWMAGVDYTIAPLTFGIAYVDTNITKRESAYLQPNFSSTKDGSSIASGKVLFSVTAAF